MDSNPLDERIAELSSQIAEKKRQLEEHTSDLNRQKAVFEAPAKQSKRTDAEIKKLQVKIIKAESDVPADEDLVKAIATLLSVVGSFTVVPAADSDGANGEKFQLVPGGDNKVAKIKDLCRSIINADWDSKIINAMALVGKNMSVVSPEMAAEGLPDCPPFNGLRWSYSASKKRMEEHNLVRNLPPPPRFPLD